MEKYKSLLLRILAAICLSLLLSGCMVGPHYQEPQTELSEEFAPLPEDANGLDLSGPIPETWWALFDDAVLLELIQAAAAANHDIRIATTRLMESRAGRTVAASDLYPEIGFGGTAETRQQSKNSPEFAGGDSRSDFFQAGFDASWEIDIFGGVQRRVEAAEARLQAAEAGRDEVIRVVLAEVALNYMEMRGLQQQKQVLERNIKVQQETVDFTRNRLDAGLGNEFEVSQAKAQLLSTTSTLPAIQAAIQLRIFALGTLLGESPASRRDQLLEYTPLPQIPKGLFTGIPSELLQRRPDIKRAERLLAAEVADIGAAKADLYPRISLLGGYAAESGATDVFFDTDSLAWTLGPSVRLPLFQGNRIRANIKAQQAQSEGALAEYEKTILNALLEVNSALIEHSYERRTALSLEEALAESKNSVLLSQVLYQEGLSDILNVLNAESLLLRVENDFAQSRTKEWTSLIRLYKALGGGWKMQG